MILSMGVAAASGNQSRGLGRVGSCCCSATNLVIFEQIWKVAVAKKTGFWMPQFLGTQFVSLLIGVVRTTAAPQMATKTRVHLTVLVVTCLVCI